LSDAVLYDAAHGVATITINRPERRNSINPDVIDGIEAALRRAEGDTSIGVAVLTGAGAKAFCAGGDLGGMDGTGAVDQHFRRAGIGELFASMRGSRLPIVARVNGHALAGGFGLMLACDLVIAVEEAVMGTPDINVGLWPFIVTAIMQRDIPRKIALDLMLTGRRMSASEGEHWGFVNRVVPANELDAATEKLAATLASKSPLVAALGKRSFYAAEDRDFEDALEYLAGMLSLCLQSEDAAEGVSAFFEKRAPVWKGR
jgi:enoyl-CoA hydratase